ncbi:MAG: ADP-heptose--LPS heptosyltransferase [Alphaproteobacteria bacterium]|nr:ADP-heptose--LPS heptosyltransferase [Alphaproteobacteria bacterium]
MSEAEKPNILVIKLGALGDVVQALGPMAAIRRHHANAHVVLLTSAPFADFLRASPYFDEVWVDTKPHKLNLLGLLSLRARLRGGKFARVYDLQTSDRSSLYFKIMAPRRPEWSGIAPGASHPHANPKRNAMHTVDRQRDQLAMAGIEDVPASDLSWVRADIARLKLAEPYALLIPGGSAGRPAKRWPVAKFAALANELTAHGVTPVLIGGPDEKGLGEAIRAVAPRARDLIGKTGFADIPVMAREAGAAIGNDTGPMHLVAASGCPSVVLFSAESDPKLCAPRGAEVAILRRENLQGLGVDEVLRVLFAREGRPERAGRGTKRP